MSVLDQTVVCLFHVHLAVVTVILLYAVCVASTVAVQSQVHSQFVILFDQHSHANTFVLITLTMASLVNKHQTDIAVQRLVDVDVLAITIVQQRCPTACFNVQCQRISTLCVHVILKCQDVAVTAKIHVVS